MALTKEEVRAIADALLEAAEKVDAYLDANFQKISREEYDSVNESFKTLVRKSVLVTTEAVGLAIDDLANPANELKVVIDEVKKEITKLQTIGLIISLVAGLADLAASIVARNPDAIIASVINLKNKIGI
jgi:hypothetical protein